MAHGLDHFDGHQLIVPAGEIAVILIEYRDAVRKPGLLDASARHRVLLARNSCRRDSASIGSRGVHREPTPPRTNFEHVIVGPQIKLATQPIVFGDRRVTQGGRRRLEDPAGVGQCVVQKQ